MQIDMKFSITPQVIDLDLGEVQQVTKIVPVPTAEVDDTLSKEGYAADAKAVGDALAGMVKSVNGVLPDKDGNVLVEIPSGGGGTADISEIDATKVVFSEDLMTTAQIGNVKLENGQATIEAAGKNLVEVWNSIFVQERTPAITQPSVALTFAAGKAYEVGTEVTAAYSATLNPGKYEYGPDTGVTATEWEITDTEGNTSDAASGSFPAITVGDEVNYKITAKATYEDGAIPVTNLGNDYPDGQIKAGAKSATSTKAISGYRNTFYGTMEEKTTVDSTAIRALSNRSGKALSNDASFTVVIPVGALRVVIAYPATLQDVTSIKDVNGLNSEISSSFTLTEVDVEGENGYTAIPYKVYTLDFARANDTENTFDVII